MTRFIRFVSLTIVTAVLSNNVYAANDKYGYAWANKSAAKSYVPDRSYSYNSSGKVIKISRKQIGQYVVNFKGIGGNGKKGGHVQVTAYGSGKQQCKVSRWDSKGRDFIVDVNCFLPNGRPADSMYTVSVKWPAIKKIANIGSMTDVKAITKNSAVKRKILKNGHVQLIFNDGTIEERYPGGITITRPGQAPSTMMFSTQAPPAIPPQAPDNSEGIWLNYHGENLLSIIKKLVKYDEAQIANYLQYEGKGLSSYEQITKRRKVISHLVSP